MVGVCFSPMARATELKQVVNLKHAKNVLHLTKRQLSLLSSQGFFVSPGDSYGIEDVYGENVYTELPSLVTADTVLQVLHTTYDASLRATETNHLKFSLRRMVNKLLVAALHRYEASPSSAALRNVAYLGVGDRLLGGSSALPDPVKAKVRRELQLIGSHEGLAVSPLFGYQVDYSQFIVRGHYTRSEDLKRYFRTSMWFGLVPIALEKRVGNRVTPLPDNVKSVRMLVQDWEASGAKKDWSQIDRIVTGFVGPANNVTPPVWEAAGGRLDRLPQPQIVSKVMHGTQAGAKQFRLMAQRSIPDSVVFNRLTGPNRYWPSPLDVATVLGSSHAAQLLDKSPNLYNPKGWKEYSSVRSQLAAQWASWPSSVRTADLYHRQLGLLIEFLKPLPSSAAAFYRSNAYGDLQITTSLASWAELRHDSLLYWEQSVAEMGDGDEPKHMKGYVEPRPAFYAQAAAWASHLKRLLAVESFLSPDQSDRLGKFVDLVRFFQRISEDELAGRRPSKTEYDRLWTIEQDLSGLEMQMLLQGMNYNALTLDDLDMAVVADVHSAEGMALEVGTGHADDLLAIVPVEGNLYLARGSVLSFYEVRVPASKRMNDHTWKELARNGKLPRRPSWMRSYYASPTTRRK